MSFLCLYLRAFTTTRFRRAVYVVIGLVCCQTVGTWFFYGLQCIPIDAFFHPELYPANSCVASSLSYYPPTIIVSQIPHTLLKRIKLTSGWRD